MLNVGINDYPIFYLQVNYIKCIYINLPALYNISNRVYYKIGILEDMNHGTKTISIRG